MDLAEALDVVAAKFTPRFRELCDKAHPDYDPATIPIVLRMAQGLSPHPPMAEPIPRPTTTPARSSPAPSPDGAKAIAIIRQAREADQLVNRCPHRGCRTGCGQAECHAGRGDLGEGGVIASMTHCRQCVRGEVGPVPLDVALWEWWLQAAEVAFKPSERADPSADLYV